MFGSNVLHCGFDCVTQDGIDNFLFSTSSISSVFLIFSAARFGCRDQRTAVWIVIAFFQSLLLLSRANREGLELEPKQRLLFLWAIEVFCCFVFFLWSFQDPPALEAESLYQYEKEAQAVKTGAENGDSMKRVA